MGSYNAIRKTFIEEYKARSQAYKSRLIKWNAEPPIVRVGKPTNLARARQLGYRAKQGVVVARAMVTGGSNKRQRPDGGRKPSKSGRFFTRAKSVQAIAEERVARKFPNCEVLNSYFVGKAGTRQFYEVVLLDRTNPAITADPVYSRIVAQRNRAQRGLTAAGRRHRGIMSKGFGSNQTRPSRRAVSRG